MRGWYQALLMVAVLGLLFQFDGGVRQVERRCLRQLLLALTSRTWLVAERSRCGSDGGAFSCDGGSRSGAPGTSPAFPDGPPCQALWVGPGWYCIKGYGGPSPEALCQVAQQCEEISTHEQWDRARFGVCRHTPDDAFPYQMAVTDGIAHHTRAEAEATFVAGSQE